MGDDNMKYKLTIGVVTGMLLAGSAVVATATPLDLSSGWSEVSLANDSHKTPSWSTSNGGRTVTQANNGDASVYLSDAAWSNTSFDGSFRVNTGYDDDFIGFVFGYTGVNDYYLFDWKQKDQDWSGDGYEGFTLSHITGDDINLWGHTGDNLEVLATDYDADGWADREWYDLDLSYASSNFNISVNDVTVFDMDGSYEAGQFGFYSYSQRGTAFTDFSATSNPVPEPQTMLLFGVGLMGLAFQVKRRTAVKEK
jgi:hypothetical protein